MAILTICVSIQRCFPKPGQAAVVGSLRLQKRGETQKPVLPAARVKEADSDQALEIAEFSPIEQPDFAALQQFICIPKQSVKHFGNTHVLRAVITDRQNLGNQQDRPRIVTASLFVLAGTNPAVGPLRAQDGVDVPPGTGNHIPILKQIGKRNEPVQPIGNALPALAAAADPGAVPNVGPDGIQMAAKPGSLDFKLTLQPAARLQLVCCIKIPCLHKYRPVLSE